MRRKLLLIGMGICSASILGASAAQAQEFPQPLIEFTFEGESLANTGSLGGEGVFDNPLDGHDRVPEFGPGVLLPGKISMVQDTAGMGTQAPGGDRAGALLYEPGPVLDEVESITITGWFNTSELFDHNAMLVTRSEHFWIIGRSATGRFALQFTDEDIGVRRLESETAWHQERDQWTFFAVTFDNTISIFDEEPNARVYYAYLNSDDVILDNVASLDNGTVRNDQNVDAIAIGNVTQFFHRPFDGRIANVRVFASDSDGSGALSEAEIQAIWEADRPDFIPVETEIFTAVEVAFDGETGRVYQIESSTDLESWQPVGEMIEGQGEAIQRLFSTQDEPRRFFRVLGSD